MCLSARLPGVSSECEELGGVGERVLYSRDFPRARCIGSRSMIAMYGAGLKRLNADLPQRFIHLCRDSRRSATSGRCDFTTREAPAVPRPPVIDCGGLTVGRGKTNNSTVRDPRTLRPILRNVAVLCSQALARGYFAPNRANKMNGHSKVYSSLKCIGIFPSDLPSLKKNTTH